MRFKQQLTKAAGTCMGSGWGALVWDTLSGRLLTVQIHDHESQTVQGAVPLLVLDAWEHAYYLQYQNEKAKFFDAIWNVWNWKDVAERFERARSLSLIPEQATSPDRQPTAKRQRRSPCRQGLTSRTPDQQALDSPQQADASAPQGERQPLPSATEDAAERGQRAAVRTRRSATMRSSATVTPLP